MDVITILQIMIGVIIFIMVLLVVFYLYLIRPKTQKKDDKSTQIEYENEDKSEKKIDNFGRFQGELTQESIFEFMEFDEVVDNMIVRKNKTQYIMVLQCNGVNYDLMSEQEKIAVEEGFVQFLNTLRFPIQLYVQSRTLNLKDIVAGYKERVNAVNNDIAKIDMKIEQAKRANNQAAQEKLYFEKRRKQNVLEYGMDITNYVERLNSNQNILQQKTYVVVSFFTSELGTNTENYTKDELNSMCFSELYTRCQNISSSLMGSQVSSRILESEELMELLYVAYNRDESELYQLQKALDAQYDALYTTGKDVLQKKQEKLDKEINIAAIDMATDSILRADKQKQMEDLEKEQKKTQAIKDKASELLNQYEDQLNPRVFEIAKENIEKSSENEEKKIEAEKAKVKSTEEAQTGERPVTARRTTKTVAGQTAGTAARPRMTAAEAARRRAAIKKDGTTNS